MQHGSEFVRWLELSEAQPVRFGDLPGLIASVLHADEFAQACAEINLEAELRALVNSGEMLVRDRSTLGRHTFPHGAALLDAVMLPSDLRPLLASRGIGLRLRGEAADPLPQAPIEGHHQKGITGKPLDQWTDEEIEATRRQSLATSHKFREIEEGMRMSRAIDALFSSDLSAADALPTLHPSPATAAPVPVSGVTHKTMRRARPLADVFAEAERQALDATDWISVWGALVKIASAEDRPAPLLGYVEGEGVKYGTDNSEKPVAYLTREAFRKYFTRKYRAQQRP